MNIQRGDVLKARFPHASGERGTEDFENSHL